MGRLNLDAKVYDVMTGRLVLSKKNPRTGNIIRDGANYLNEGFYRITYKADAKEDGEYFLIGSPKSAFENMKTALLGDAWDAATQLNIVAQIRRAEILPEAVMNWKPS